MWTRRTYGETSGHVSVMSALVRSLRDFKLQHSESFMSFMSSICEYSTFAHGEALLNRAAALLEVT